MLVLAPRALELVKAFTVPDLIVNPLVKVFTPLRFNAEVALFWITPVTFVPMIPLMALAALPLPELVIVPVMLGAPEIVMTPPAPELSTMLPE